MRFLLEADCDALLLPIPLFPGIRRSACQLDPAEKIPFVGGCSFMHTRDPAGCNELGRVFIPEAGFVFVVVAA